MRIGLRADRPGRGTQSDRRVRVFDAVDTVRTDIRCTGPVFRRPRYAAVYCARNGRRDQPLFVRSSKYSEAYPAAVAFLNHKVDTRVSQS